MRTAVVIGAGVTGLAAARRLVAAGHAVTVLEAEAEPGGLCRSVTLGGCRFDLGPHFIHDVTARRVGIADAVPVMLFEAIRRGGRGYAFPFGLLREPRYVASVGRAYARRLAWGLPEGSLGTRLRAAYGGAFYDEIMAPLLGKWLGVDLDDVAPILARRFDPPDPRVLLFHLKVRLLRRHSDYFHQQRQYVYPHGGMAAVVARLAAGLDVRCGVPARRLLVAGGRVTGVETDAGMLGCDGVVTTAPADATAALLAGVPDVRAPRLTTRGVIVVLMTFARPPVTGQLWTWFPEARYPFYRVSEMPHLAPTRAADAAAWARLAASFAPPGETGIAAEICAAPGGRWWSAAEDDEVITATRAGLRAAYGLTTLPRAVRVVRAAGAYPSFRLAEQADWAAPPRFGVRGLVSAGRAAEHRYHMVEQALDAGERAADELAAPLAPA
jgi:protoporphyrinogen oxidase